MITYEKSLRTKTNRLWLFRTYGNLFDTGNTRAHNLWPQSTTKQKFILLQWVMTSVTRLGNLLDFGQLFKAFGNNYLPKSPTFLGNFCKGVKIYPFSSEIIFGKLLQTFGDIFLVTLHSTQCVSFHPAQEMVL